MYNGPLHCGFNVPIKGLINYSVYYFPSPKNGTHYRYSISDKCFDGFHIISVILELVRSKCIPILLYGLESCQLSNADLRSLDFTFNRLFMKLFKTKSIDVVKACQSFWLRGPKLCFKKENR